MGRIFILAALVWAILPAHFGDNVPFREKGIGRQTALPAAVPTPENPKCTSCVRGDGKPNASPNVTGITFDRNEVRLKCSDDRTGTYNGSNVEVATTAEDPDGDVLTYNYTISGGRIVGTGKRVIWNLDGVKPGTYSITARVDDGCGMCGKTESRTISVSECTSAD